jgi:hypothetical protein
LVSSTWQSRRVLPALRDKAENWSRALVKLQRPGYCSSTEFNPGLLLAFSLDIIPWEDTLHNGLIDSPLPKRRGTEEETSAHISCKCEVRWHSDILIGVLLFLDPGDVRSLNLQAIWNFITRTGFPWLGLQSKRHKGPVKGLCASGPKGLKLNIYSILFYNTSQHFGKTVSSFRCIKKRRN